MRNIFLILVVNMSSQPKTSKNIRPRKHYNKPKNYKRNHKCRESCDSCVNINININNGGTGTTGATDCFAVNDRCNEQLTSCYELVGDNLLGRVVCEDAYNNCFTNAGCQQGGGGGSSTCPGEGKIEAYRACVRRCVVVGGHQDTVSDCITDCGRTHCGK